jgi:hypothetical protein
MPSRVGKLTKSAFEELLLLVTLNHGVDQLVEMQPFSSSEPKLHLPAVLILHVLEVFLKGLSQLFWPQTLATSL